MKDLLLKGFFLSVITLSLFPCIFPSQVYADGTRTAIMKVASTAPVVEGEQKWDTILAKAKKEGTVTLYVSWTPAVRIALSKAFKERYGINLEFSPFVRADEIQVKIQTEQRAGLYLVDVIGGATAALLTALKPAGLLGPIKPLLILPEVSDPKAWRGEKLPFLDKEGLAFSMIMNVGRLVVYNSNLIKDGEITSVRDLLNPKYKGKITLNDPTVTGAGAALMAHLGHNLWGEAEATDFLKRLIKEQDVPIQTDNRMQIETVARGKYAIALGELPSVVDELTRAGAPIKVAHIKEDNRAAAANGAIGVPVKFAHPNAALIFLNWLLSKEGQSVFAVNFGNPSTRMDASTKGIMPDFIPSHNEKYFLDSAEFAAATSKWMKISKQIITETK